MRATAIIPARYASTRFPGKPLVPLAGLPMILHVAERLEAARAAGILDAVLVATDDRRILETVRDAGFEVQHTSPRHPTGTDRVAEVARYREDDVICNVPCDEPGIAPQTLEALIQPLRDDPELPMSTLKTRISCASRTPPSSTRASPHSSISRPPISAVMWVVVVAFRIRAGFSSSPVRASSSGDPRSILDRFGLENGSR